MSIEVYTDQQQNELSLFFPNVPAVKESKNYFKQTTQTSEEELANFFIRQKKRKL